MAAIDFRVKFVFSAFLTAEASFRKTHLCSASFPWKFAFIFVSSFQGVFMGGDVRCQDQKVLQTVSGYSLVWGWRGSYVTII